MKRIDKLTPEQAARFGEWTKKWVGIGLSTEPADFDAATDAGLRAYKLCNLDRPMVILRMGSPYAATIGGAMAWSMLHEFSKRGTVRDQVWAQVGDQVRDQVWAQVRDQVRDQVGDQVRDQVWAQVGDQVWDQVWDQVGDQVRAQVRAQVWDQVWAQVGAQVRDQVRASSFRAAKDGLYNEGASNIGWAGFAAWVSYFRDVCGWENETLTKFEITETLVKSCGWTWWHQNVLAISDRPRVINRDTAGRLHCEDGPSIAYRDGWSLYHWHGMTVPKDIIERPQDISLTRINAESNAEIRRVMVERYGHERYLRESDAKLIDSCPVDHPLQGLRTARLWACPGDIVMLDVLNSTPEPDGTTKRYVIPVDGSRYGGRAGRECVAATASTWRKRSDPTQLAFARPEDYAPAFES